MLLCDFSIQKGQFVRTELPIIEGESHSYKTRGKHVRNKGRSHKELDLRNKRMSTASRVLDESYGSDNGMLRASGSLWLDIQPYLDHYNKSGYQQIPNGRGYMSSEKNDDRRTRSGWIQDLEYKKHKEKTRRNTLKAIKNALFRYRVDPITHSHGNNYKKLSGAPYGPGEG